MISDFIKNRRGRGVYKTSQKDDANGALYPWSYSKIIPFKPRMGDTCFSHRYRYLVSEDKVLVNDMNTDSITHPYRWAIPVFFTDIDTLYRRPKYWSTILIVSPIPDSNHKTVSSYHTESFLEFGLC